MDLLVDLQPAAGAEKNETKQSPPQAPKILKKQKPTAGAEKTKEARRGRRKIPPGWLRAWGTVGGKIAPEAPQGVLGEI